MKKNKKIRRHRINEGNKWLLWILFPDAEIRIYGASVKETRRVYVKKMMVVIRGDYLLRKIHDNHRCARHPKTDTEAWCGFFLYNH